MDVIVSMAITVILLTIKQAVKDPVKKAELRSALTKVRDAITALYPDEE